MNKMRYSYNLMLWWIGLVKEIQSLKEIKAIRNISSSGLRNSKGRIRMRKQVRHIWNYRLKLCISLINVINYKQILKTHDSKQNSTKNNKLHKLHESPWRVGALHVTTSCVCKNMFLKFLNQTYSLGLYWLG